MADSNQISLYGGDLKIKVSLQDANMEFYILAQQFIHYIRSEAFSSIGRPSVGLYIPNAELKFLVAGTGRFLKLIQDSKVRIEITLIKSDEANAKENTYFYKATNFDYVFNGANIEVTMYMISDIGDFMNLSAMTSYKDMSSIQAIYKATELANIEIAKDSIESSYTTNDTMTWIQPNISYLQFVSNVLRHINLQGDDAEVSQEQDNTSSQKGDLILGAFNNDKLRLISYAKSMETPAEIGFYVANKSYLSANGVKTPYQAKNIRVESSLGLYEFLADVKGIPIIRVVGENRNNSLLSSIFNIFSPSSSKKATTSNRVLPPKIDCGNTHKNYWQSAFNNEKMISQIYRNVLYATIDNILITDELNILDSAQIDLSNVGEKDNNGISLKGNFIVLGINKYIDKEQISNQVIVSRAEYQ